MGSVGPGSGDIAAAPFGELLEPLADAAVVRLTRTAGAALTGVAPSALAEARTALVQRLSWLAAPQLYARLDALRATGGGYDDFAARHRGTGWRRFLEPLPELERLLGVVADRWVAALGELLARLEDDRPRLGAILGDRPPGVLTGLRWPLSDPHRGGRAVAELTFDDGRRLVYKPRDVRAEEAFAALVHALADASGQPPMRTPAVLARDGYGWAEHVVAVACTGPAAAERYHRRAGVLAALFHALGSRDMHQGNVLACGEHPVVVDAETVLRADVEPPRDDALATGVLESMLLPHWLPVRRGLTPATPQGAEVGALGAGGGTAGGERWTGIGTDRMAYAIEPRALPATAERPHVNGRPVAAADHLDALRASFAAAYRTLAHWGPDLLQPGGAGHGLAGTEARVLWRNTSAYHALLYEGRRRACLASPAVRAERLRDGLSAAAGPRDPAVEAAEHEALRDLDVPIFTVPATGGPLVFGGDVTAEPLGAASARLAGLGEADLARQDALLRAAVSRPWPERREPRPAVGAPPPIDDEATLAAATAIAEEIAAAAVPAPGGAVTWIGATVDAPTGRTMAGPIGAGLHGGGLGVAVFLGELARRIGDGERWRGLALAAAAPARARGDAHALDLGLADGIGGRVHGLCRVARATGDRSLLDDAAGWARELTPERLDRDACGDLLRGGAGAVVGLLALHAATGDEVHLEAALAAGRRLTGAPGAALALALLARAAGDRTLAATAIARHRSAGGAGIPGWCARDAGTARCAIAIGEALDGLDPGAERVRADALTAVDRLAGAPLGGIDDTLAQGEAGRVEALLAAARSFGRPELAVRARGLAAELLAAGRAEGGLRLIAAGVPNRLVPGLLCGTAGVGLTLLRLAAPDAIAPLLDGARARGREPAPVEELHDDDLAAIAGGGAPPPPPLPLDFV